ncbi:pyrroloquinoline quinone biosynthesis protein PqqB [Methylocystis sp. WRRC1]|uniref:pyrroloquinoline quinone biosynthesis protein PqqB n=1 Tax=unclassified Methylocystis TaxID=2625913 RepID=UPI00056315E2|nr:MULTISPECIES: pyrroloquinoline quinone biosynthesis protein PqqB [unclassified Methylocystis]MCC3244184.1 pyrroloquinoline quinone biosynthesis protein PqqB [Methylocystis sp. WRRC1]
MRIRILGSGAGGGFPQWNCNCANCRAVRDGVAGYVRRTQSSLAVSADGANWVLLNASPDLREQIAAAPELSPRHDDPLRASPIKAVALTNGDVDHVAGLLNLREAQPFSVYAAQRVLDALKANPIFSILQPALVPRIELQMDQPIALSGAGVDLGLSIRAFPVPGKIALYLEDANAPNFGTSAGDTLGLEVIESKTGKSFFYIPGCARVDAPLAARLKDAALVFFDGTLFHENEMIEQGLMGKTGSRMGHVNMSGDDGSMAAFAPLNVARKIYVHINNSNPVLNEFSDEYRVAQTAGWEIGEDGMEVRL